MAAPGDGVLLGPPMGPGEGERWRLGRVGEGGRFDAGEVKDLSFSGFCMHTPKKNEKQKTDQQQTIVSPKSPKKPTKICHF